MGKKLLILVFLGLTLNCPVKSQNMELFIVSKKKAGPINLDNEIFVGYGIGTLYLFSGMVNHDYSTDYYNQDDYGSASIPDIHSIGTFSIGYNRILNRIIMVGFTGSYLQCNYTRNFNEIDNSWEVDYTENLLNGMAKITFNYLNKPMIRVYSGIGLGITVDLSSARGQWWGVLGGFQSPKETDKRILPAGQLTFLGVRFGRNFGGFCEFGIGTNAIISAGLSYQFVSNRSK